MMATLTLSFYTSFLPTFNLVFVITCGALYCLFPMSLYKHIIMSLFFFLSKGLCNVELRLSLKFCGLCRTIVYIQELHYPWLLEFLQLELLPIFLLCLSASIYRTAGLLLLYGCCNNTHTHTLDKKIGLICEPVSIKINCLWICFK